MPAERLRLDLKGLKCPLPALHTRRALERAAHDAVIEVECTDPMAVIDIPHLVRQMGHELEAQEKLASSFLFRIRAMNGDLDESGEDEPHIPRTT